MIAVTLSVWQPAMRWARTTLQGLLSARDVTLYGIAHLLELPRELVELFADLFFPVRTRGVSFMASLAFPQTPLGVVTETETEFAQLELNLMRVVRDYGWQEVARCAGLAPIEDDRPIDDQVEDLERLTSGNASWSVGPAGLIAGLRGSRTRSRSSPHAEAKQKDDDSRRGLAGMSLGMSINESFMRVMAPDLARRLAIQSGMETEQLNKPKERAPAARC